MSRLPWKSVACLCHSTAEQQGFPSDRSVSYVSAITVLEKRTSTRDCPSQESMCEVGQSEEAEDPQRPRPRVSQERAADTGAHRTRFRCVVLALAYGKSEEQDVDHDDKQARDDPSRPRLRFPQRCRHAERLVPALPRCPPLGHRDRIVRRGKTRWSTPVPATLPDSFV